MAFADYIESQLGEAKYNLTRTEAHFDCPFCTDTRKRFRFNSSKMLGHCFNCNWNGNAVRFVKDYHKLRSWSEAFDIVSVYHEFQPLPQDIYEEVFDKLFIEGQEIDYKKRAVPLPSDFRLLSITTSRQADIFRNYARKRLLSEKQIEIHGVGYCTEGEIKITEDKKILLKNRLIVQSFDDALNPIYWVGRALFPEMTPKAINPLGSVATIDKSDVVFNLNNAKKTGFAVVTEGIFDATTVGDSGIALFGKTISARQLLLILKGGFEAIYVMLDPDAILDAIKIADLFSKHHPDVFLCHLDGGDPNEVGRSGVLRALQEAERYNALTALKYRLR